MIRFSMLTLAAAMLLAMGNSPLPAGREAATSQMQDAPTSSYDFPAEHDRSFFGWETVQLFAKAGAMSSQHRQASPGRVFRFFALGMSMAVLHLLALSRRGIAIKKARPVIVRLLTLPLGSHAPPVFSNYAYMFCGQLEDEITQAA